ncbi:hypothetical protein ABPG74_015550 [Tetrahymena malaccensis]
MESEQAKSDSGSCTYQQNQECGNLNSYEYSHEYQLGQNKFDYLSNTQENFNQIQMDQNQFSNLLNTYENPYSLIGQNQDSSLLKPFDDFYLDSNFDPENPLIYGISSGCSCNQIHINPQSTGEGQSNSFYGQSGENSSILSLGNQNSQQQFQQVNKNKKGKRDYKLIAKMLNDKIEKYLNKNIEVTYQDELNQRIKKWQSKKKIITNENSKNIYKSQLGLSIICFPNHSLQSISSNDGAQKIFAHFLQNTQDEIPFEKDEYMKQEYKEKLDRNIQYFNDICSLNQNLVQELAADNEQMKDQVDHLIRNIENIYNKKQKQKQKSKESLIQVLYSKQ